MRTTRRSGPIPLAKWLTSANPSQRTHAETALYYLGPDAGNALFAAIQDESRFVPLRAALAQFVGEVFLISVFFGLLVMIWQPHLSALWAGAVALAGVQAIARMVLSLMRRRQRVRTLALAMARRNDERCIGPLIEVWRPVSGLYRLQADADVEQELTRLLPAFMKQHSLSLHPEKIDLLRARTAALVAALEVADADAFTGERVDLLVTVIRYLAAGRDVGAASVLRRVAQLPGATPNEMFVRDAARLLLDAPRDSQPAPSAPPVVAPPTRYAPPTTPIVRPAALKRQEP